MSRVVLVLSEDLDSTADAVVDELGRRGTEVFRCDAAWFPTEMSLDAQLVGDVWRGWLTTEHRRVGLEDLRSAWLLRPTTFRFPPGLSEPERRHALWEAKIGVGGVLASLPLVWVSHPSAESRCGYPVRSAVRRSAGGETAGARHNPRGGPQQGTVHSPAQYR